MCKKNDVRKLELEFREGSPDGLRGAHLSLWDGKLLLAPRIQIRKSGIFWKQKELKSSCIYLLRNGEDEERPKVYIGQTETLHNRIRDHNKANQDWWTEIIIISSSKDRDLNSIELKYLEARMIDEMKKANRVDVKNDKSPKPPKNIDEATKNTMEWFIDGIKEILPLVRIDDLVNDRKAVKRGEQLPEFQMYIPKSEKRAKGFPDEEHGKFIVLKDSLAQLNWVGTPSSCKFQQKLREDLKSEGILIEKDGFLQFTKDYPFSSISAAAKVVAGASYPGTTDWKTPDPKTGKLITFKEWQEIY